MSSDWASLWPWSTPSSGGSSEPSGGNSWASTEGPQLPPYKLIFISPPVTLPLDGFLGTFPKIFHHQSKLRVI